MKKHLIAAAVAAAVAVPAMAQNVSVSGVFDVTAIGNTKASTELTSTSGAVSTKTSATANNNGWSTSELIFSGSEDLGGGLTVSFRLATGLTGGASPFADRDRNIALSGSFGTVRAGRLVPAAGTGFNAYTAAGTTNQAGTLYGLSNFSTTAIGQNAANFGGLTAGTFERNNNQIQYTSPTINGFVVNVNYGTSTTDTSANNGKAKTTQSGLHVGYNAGPLSAGIAINKREVDAEGALAATGVLIDGDLNWVGASYNFGMATVGLSRITREDSTAAAVTGIVTRDADIKINALGVTVPMGAVTLRGTFYDGDNARTALANDDLDLSGYQLSATYALSKRTVAYAVIGQNKAERAGGNTGPGAIKSTSNVIGLTHSF